MPQFDFSLAINELHDDTKQFFSETANINSYRSALKCVDTAKKESTFDVYQTMLGKLY